MRRLFIILILIIVIFVFYRYINPDGANEKLAKIKNIPNNISSWFSKDKFNINVESKSTIITGDIEDIGSDINTNDNKDYQNRLEILNKEIEAILGKDKKEIVVDETVLTGTKEIVENTGSEMSGELETNTSTGIVVETNTGSIVETKKEEVETVVTNTTSNVNNTVWSDLDIQQIREALGNLFK